MSERRTWHGGTAVLRTARKVHYCSSYDYMCTRTINPGDKYVRSVMFPNHDVSGYDAPVSMDTCLGCATRYDHIKELTGASA